MGPGVPKRDRVFADLTDVTLADEYTNSNRLLSLKLELSKIDTNSI